LGGAGGGPPFIAVNVLSQKRDFLETTVAEVAHFAEDAFHITAALTATGERHNAIVTEVVATAHDADKTANFVTQTDTLRYHITISLGCGEFHIDGLMAEFSLCNKVGECEIGIRSGHEITVVILQKVVLYALSHTAEDSDD
jgi:hypothetical protein